MLLIGTVGTSGDHQNSADITIRMLISAGCFDEDYYVLDSTTISWNVMAAAGAERERLSLEIRRQLTLGGVAMTTEMWTDAYGQISYITVTVHYVDAHWELQSRVAFTKEVDMARKQPGRVW